MKEYKKDKKIKNIKYRLNNTSNFKIYELLLFAVLIIACTIFLTIVITNELNKNENKKSTSLISKTDKLSEFEEVYNIINNSYYKKVNQDKLIEGAINGMLSSLDDPHTSYFTKEQTDSFNEIMNGSYEGIGAEISIDKNNNIIILSVFKNSPAAEVGLKYGDIIISVNGTVTTGKTTNEVVSLIKDSSKSTVNIKIKRGEEELEFNVTKRIVVIDSIESEIYNIDSKNIGYIAINTFANNTYEQFKSALESLESKNISGLIIDVRDNSGGYLHSVTHMLDMFMPKGTVLYQISDNKKTYKYTSSTSESRNYPICVLTNKSSASASEILAISLKESYGADVIGTYTYGKGTVQITKDLSNGGMIKYTIQKWLSPKGNWINGVGVEPTVSVELQQEYINNPTIENDNQLQTALKIISEK